jgi:hypothetical protein
MVSDLPDMEAVREKLTGGRSDPVLLQTILHEEASPGGNTDGNADD